MGVPKFFRYMSERYPCLSEIVKEYQLPEFDNLYLDMNGIIHMCSHPDDNNPHFRITEEKIFCDIFHYIEVLFRMIRPQQLFFMAVDGVAPRAKMNQQRGRRFRSAKDADKMELEAKKKGEVLPDAARFDSNCITPGTAFMARLHEQLKYFVVEKISTDPLWRKCKIILSGHETPGEGEHKIMDYIRYMRAQPGYNPNTRHCLYGLDADLIMLGLCTHEPHFSLLREEVKFGKKSTKRMSVPEEITYFLLHLSLMREYLELEFASLKGNLKGFEYDFEKIIDDWVLMGFLVGNDFIPHLPNLHIANGALPILYEAYMNILPTLDGYINEEGTLNLGRFEKFMEKLGDLDVEKFEEIRDDLLYMEAKTGRKCTAHTAVSSKPRDLEEWSPEDGATLIPEESLEPETVRNPDLAVLIKQTDDMCLESLDEACDSEEDDAFENHKKEYYRNKLEYANVTPQVMRDQAEGYVRAIQWNLHYYYNGVCSWSWYYPHHYAPYISDIKGFADLKIEFDLGTPFKPYEQLLAVLPSASKNLLPDCYHHLMTDEKSVIKQYYPEEFQTDLNGKKQEWEAVVLIPFIDENLLLEAMATCNDQLTDEERKRNTHGPMLVYTFTTSNLGVYLAPEYFATIPENHAGLTTLSYDDVRVPVDKLVKGAYPGVRTNVFYPGFPTMKHLKYKGHLRNARIRVFETPSRNENMIVKIIRDEIPSDEDLPLDILGTTIFVGWPHLVETKVVAVSNSKRKYVSIGAPGEYSVEERTGHMAGQFPKEIQAITEFYKNRMGIECGETNVLVYVNSMIGRRYMFTPNGRISLEKQFAHETVNYPLQCVVYNIDTYDAFHTTFQNVENVFPEGCTCFTLTNPYYGAQGKVMDSKDALKNGRIKISMAVVDEPDFSPLDDAVDNVRQSYRSLFRAASQLSLSNYIFSRITGSIFFTARNNEGGLKNVSAGLDLKYNKKNKETPGYTRKTGSTWQYTDKAIELVRLYIEKFPEILNFFQSNDKNDDIRAEEIFGDDCDDKVKSLQDWLKTLPTHNLERISCDSSIMQAEIISEIEKLVDGHPKNNIKNVVMQIRPSFLYRPEIQNGTLLPDPKVDVKIMDRIVNVREGFSVPFGLKGTIIGINGSNSTTNRDLMYDIVFDSPFKDGMTLNCSAGRGYRLPITSFVNISYGKRLLDQKMGKGKPSDLVARAGATENFDITAYSQNYNKQQFGQKNSAFASFNIATGPRFPGGVPQQNNSAYNSFSQKPPPKVQNFVSNGNFRENVVVPKCTDNFMPQFGVKQSKLDVSDNNNEENERLKEPVKPVNKVEMPRQKVSIIDTEMLRNILKIGSNSSPSSSNVSENAHKSSSLHKREPVNMEPPPNRNEPSTSSSNSNCNGSLSFKMFAQAAKAPASVRLLTYYQSNGLGLPRYQYFNNQSFVQAQITLHNGDIITGRKARNREEASENVAGVVLEILLNGKKPESLPKYSVANELPVPPKVWVHQQKNNQHPRNNQHNHQKEHQQNTKFFSNSNQPRRVKIEKGSKAAALHNSFVPLQAVQKHIKKMDNVKKDVAAGGGGSKNGESEKVVSQSKDTITVVQKEEATSSGIEKPKKSRKTRIAANFQKK